MLPVTTFCGTGVRGLLLLAAAVLDPRGRPGVEKLSSLLEDLEHMLPMLVCYGVVW